MKTSSSLGFTLIELIVGVTVLAILLSIGIPSFAEIIRSNRLTEQSNELLVALTLARSESIKRGIQVSACPANGAVCSGGSDWSTGILVFTDDTGTTGTLDVSDVLIQRWSSQANDLVANGSTSVTFQPTGALTSTSIDVYRAGCTGQKRRRVKVELTGRVGLTKENC